MQSPSTVVYEDSGWQRLLPLVYFRAVCELRCGLGTLLERVERLIAAGLRKVIRDMIRHRMVDCIVSTGAICYQDFFQARGFQHYRGDPRMDDRVLRDLLIDRIYDTLVDEEKFWLTDCGIGIFADGLERRNYSSREFIWHLSEKIRDENSFLAEGLPIVIIIEKLIRAILQA